MCIQWFTVFELMADGVVVLATSLLIEYLSFRNEVHYSPLFQYFIISQILANEFLINIPVSSVYSS